MNSKLNNILIKILVWSIIFAVLANITFGVENLIGTIRDMFANKHFDLRFSASNNSHLGQWVLIGMLLPSAVGFFKLMDILSKKIKIFNNIFFVSFLLSIVMFIGEFFVGILLNKVLINFIQIPVWDYSNMEIVLKNGFKIAFHLFGQINIFYIPVWYLTSISMFMLFPLLFKIDTNVGSILIKIIKEIFTVIIFKKGNFDKDYFSNIVKDMIE